jgi:hypothetical protein
MEEIMTNFMGIFGKAALDAVEFIRKKETQKPVEAWDKAIKHLTESAKTRKKGCPKNAFLGLYEKDLISVIHPDSNACFVENKTYFTFWMNNTN